MVLQLHCQKNSVVLKQWFSVLVTNLRVLSARTCQVHLKNDLLISSLVGSGMLWAGGALKAVHQFIKNSHKVNSIKQRSSFRYKTEINAIYWHCSAALPSGLNQVYFWTEQVGLLLSRSPWLPNKQSLIPYRVAAVFWSYEVDLVSITNGRQYEEKIYIFTLIQ